MSNYIFSTTSQDGIKVVLEASTFHGHIVPNHPEMAQNAAAIQDSIEKPMYMIRSNQNENRILYVTQSPVATYPKLYIKTVVDHTNPEVGYVRTSFFQKNLSTEKEGTIIHEKN